MIQIAVLLRTYAPYFKCNTLAHKCFGYNIIYMLYFLNVDNNYLMEF